MWVSSFNPYDSDTWPGDFDDISSPEVPPSEQGQRPNVECKACVEQEEEECSSDVETICSSDQTMTGTNLMSLKDVVSKITGYPGGVRFKDYLRGYPGLIILPPQAISMIRRPRERDGNLNYPVIFYSADPADCHDDLREIVDMLVK